MFLFMFDCHVVEAIAVPMAPPTRVQRASWAMTCPRSWWGTEACDATRVPTTEHAPPAPMRTGMNAKATVGTCVRDAVYTTTPMPMMRMHRPVSWRPLYRCVARRMAPATRPNTLSATVSALVYRVQFASDHCDTTYT
jgi:hypothetical protein